MAFCTYVTEREQTTCAVTPDPEVIDFPTHQPHPLYCKTSAPPPTPLIVALIVQCGEILCCYSYSDRGKHTIIKQKQKTKNRKNRTAEATTQANHHFSILLQYI